MIYYNQLDHGIINLLVIYAKTHEFTGEELGELLLASVRQMKHGEFSKIHQISADSVTTQATTARQAVGLSQKEFATLLGGCEPCKRGSRAGVHHQRVR